MALRFEDLRVLRAAETVADGIWRQIVRWEPFARKVVGGQVARAADSIGANIAEAFGRFHYGVSCKFPAPGLYTHFPGCYKILKLDRLVFGPDPARATKVRNAGFRADSRPGEYNAPSAFLNH